MDQLLDYHDDDSIQEMSLSPPRRNEAQTRSVSHLLKVTQKLMQDWESDSKFFLVPSV